MYNFIEYSSPIGTLTLVADQGSLKHIYFEGRSTMSDDYPLIYSCDNHYVLQKTARQLDEYFSETRTEFDLPIQPDGTAFQKSVWNALQRIPYGETISYMTLAQNIENPKAMRAVGGANGKNPIPIIIPCHRVIAADGSLGGFSGGLDNKIRLLEIEKVEGWTRDPAKLVTAASFRT